MNKSIILRIIGWILCLEAALMLLPWIVSIICKEKIGYSFAISIIICLAIGITLISKKKHSEAFFSKEGLVSVALGWIVLSVFGALPFYISGVIPSFGCIL